VKSFVCICGYLRACMGRQAFDTINWVAFLRRCGCRAVRKHSNTMTGKAQPCSMQPAQASAHIGITRNVNRKSNGYGIEGIVRVDVSIIRSEIAGSKSPSLLSWCLDASPSGKCHCAQRRPWAVRNRYA